MPLRALFFDAGNTLVFPDLARTLEPLAARGLHATQEQLHAAERAAKKRLDAARTSAPEDGSVDRQFWDSYYAHLLEDLAHPDPGLRAALVAATRQSVHWSRLRPGTGAALERLGRQYRLGLIANSDGHIAELFHSIGIGDCFASFTDSALVGYEKPDPRIFRAAHHSLGTKPEESLFVGDIYSVDFMGAQGVGMEAVLMDVAGTYRETSLPRVESLEELESWLARH